MRRTLLIASVIIVILGIGVLVYFFFFAKSPSITTTPGGNTNFPTAGQGTAATQTTENESAPSAPVVVSPRLVQISAGPVVTGEAVIDEKSAEASSTTDIAVDYIERQSGNVFTYLENEKTNTRISNKTIPGIQSASWLPDGSRAFVRYLSGTDFLTVNTYALSASSTDGFFLPQNLTDIAVSSTSVLALASGVNGSTASLSRADGTNAMNVFSTPLSSLRVGFAGKSQYLATTRASATLPGDAFLVDATGHFSRIAGPLNGLVALASPSGKYVLASYSLNGSMEMELVDASSGQTIPLPIATIADKCVWAPDSSSIYCGIPVSPPSGFSYPDDWYQGAVPFADRIWKIDVANRVAELVLDFSGQTKDSIDIESPAIDANGSTLVFVNKNDGSLWSYSL
ncbi:MAG: hypothetical protein WAN50_01730 [Minisyncoccia bacterium]